MLMDRQTDKKQMNRWNYTKRNLAVRVIYLPVKVEFNWTSVFELESGNGNIDGQTDIKQTNKWMELHQF